MIRETLTDPEGYLAERVKYPTLRPQSGVVLVAGLAANIWLLLAFTELGAATRYVESVLIILAAAGTVEYVVWWFGAAFVMHFGSSLLGGDSSFGRLLRVTGYGFVPMVVSGIIWSIGWYVGIGDAAPPDAPRSTSFRGRYEVYSDFIGPVTNSPVVLGALLVGGIFVIGSVYLWGVAVKTVTDIDDDRAFAIASIPGLLILARVLLPVL